MALDVYFQDTLRRIVLSNLVLAIRTAVANGTINPDHARGLLDAYESMAHSIGISWPDLLTDVRRSLSNDAITLLDSVTVGTIEGQCTK